MATPPSAPARTRTRCGPLTLDVVRREAIAYGVTVPLTRLEFDLLQTLMESPGRAFSRSELISRLHALDGRSPTDRALDSLVVRLRRKLRDNRRRPRLIQAVWGVGYRLAAPSSGPALELAAQSVDLIPAPALLLNGTREVVAANAAARLLFGRTLEGRRCYEVVECRLGLRALRDHCWGARGEWGREPASTDYAVTTPAGPARMRATYVPLATGRPSLCLLILSPSRPAP